MTPTPWVHLAASQLLVHTGTIRLRSHLALCCLHQQVKSEEGWQGDPSKFCIFELWCHSVLTSTVSTVIKISDTLEVSLLNNKNVGFLGCDAVPCWCQPLKMKVLYSLQLKQPHIPYDPTPQQHCCGNLSFTDHNVLDYTSSYAWNTAVSNLWLVTECVSRARAVPCPRDDVHLSWTSTGNSGCDQWAACKHPEGVSVSHPTDRYSTLV